MSRWAFVAEDGVVISILDGGSVAQGLALVVAAGLLGAARVAALLA